MLSLDTLFFCTLTALTLTLLLNSCVRNSFLITFLLYVLFVQYSIINIFGSFIDVTLVYQAPLRSIDIPKSVASHYTRIQGGPKNTTNM